MSSHATEGAPTTIGIPRRRIVIATLGVTQILAWGSSYYLLAVLAKPIADDTGWPLAWIVGGLSLGLLTAGLVSPCVGDAIERRGGRPVLATSAVLLALGLTGLALAPNLPVYIVSWLVLGLGMGAGLYDAAFATLGRLYGQRARVSIATLTLFGGLASTACWPLSAALVSEFAWRGTCLIYAAVLLGIVLPLYIFALPRETERRRSVTPTQRQQSGHEEVLTFALPRSTLLFVLLAAAITVNSMISAVVSVHLLTILQARDIALAAAVALGALVGPSQVGARAIEMLVSRYHHPVWTLLASTIFVAVGVGTLWMGLPVVSAALVFYGAGIGLESIARGTLPLAIFGERGYAATMGRIAMPSLIAQAASPSLGALLIERVGADGTLAVLFATAIIDLLLAVALFGLLPRQRVALASQGTAAS
jgi:predicted MFS family arabinose efflux permease